MNKLISLTVLLCVGLGHRLTAQNQVPISFRLGDIVVSTLSDGDRDGHSQLLTGTTPELINAQTPNGTYIMGMNAFLLQMPDSTMVLIDTGNGQQLLNNLEALQVDTADIDAVLLTHAHGDHTGGMITGGKPVFPNADVYISTPEYNYCMQIEREPLYREVFTLYKDKLHKFTPDALGKPTREILPGIHAFAAYGHTAGQCMYLVESHGDKWLFCGDVIYALALQLPKPDVALPIEADPDLGIKTREAVLKYVADGQIRVAGSHIPYPGIGDIARATDGTYRFTLLCTCEGW